MKHCKPRAKLPKKTQKHAKKVSITSNRLKKRLKSLKFRTKSGHSTALPKAPTIELGSAAFKALQSDWYARLKAQGFSDIESLNSADGLDGLLSTKGAQPMALLQAAAQTGRETYYRRLTNFVTHNPNWTNNKLYILVAVLYIEGISYRKIVAQAKMRLKVRTNIWKVHHIVALLKQRSKTWNRVHPEGLDFESDLSPNLDRLKIKT